MCIKTCFINSVITAEDLHVFIIAIIVMGAYRISRSIGPQDLKLL